MAKLVSKIYGDALFQLAMESQSIDEFLSEVKSFQAILESNQDLVKLMNHPKIDKEEKRKVMETIFWLYKKAYSPIVVTLFGIT